MTDLDGTLLDDRYPVREAARAIDTLKGMYPGVRVVLASSRTLPEMIELARHCGSEPMLVFENGAGIAWRESEFSRPGSTREQGYEVEWHTEGHRELDATLAALPEPQDCELLANTSKARALGRIKRLIRYQTGIHLVTLACGDAPHDLEMLQRADHALVFPDRDGGYLLPERNGIFHAPGRGPAPWLAGVTGVLAARQVEAMAS